MAAGRRPAIEVIGGPQLRRAIKNMDGRLDDLKDAHADAAEIVAAAARPLVDVVTGALLDTVRTDRRAAGASVLAGSARVPYAGVNHFGWPQRNIEPDPFLYDALDDRRDEVVKRYDDELADLVRKFDREAP